jgi:hypothetical protein
LKAVSRRHAVVALGAGPAVLAGCGVADVQGFPTVAAALRATEGLASGWRSTGTWDLPQTLAHLAQSIEFSMDGFPQLKPGWFRHSVGPAAFAYFEWQGAMRHGLDEPIPGAPALPPGAPLEAAVSRLSTALRRFEAHTGALQPHFAYGALDKPRATRAHLMHLAQHWTLFTRTPA